ncbi:hypothetical protein KY46_08310 [Photobacterium halotolerans]|uniref:Uncharacterized protein n=2 Tax=Photobacterium halotolerans TaxID=265726 RepID=A0A0F5VDL3_9GAMM|nr:hypothetical protein KY46_08310 [Photobacterium halotolerans]
MVVTVNGRNVATCTHCCEQSTSAAQLEIQLKNRMPVLKNSIVIRRWQLGDFQAEVKTATKIRGQMNIIDGK